MTRPDVRALLDYLTAHGGPGVEEQTPEAARAAMLAALPMADLPMGELATVREVSIPGGPPRALLLGPREDRPDGPVLGGDSAGGTLAIVTAMALRDDPAPVPVRAQLTIYPATDLTRPYPSHTAFAEGHLLTEAARRWYYGHYRPVVDEVRASPLLGDLAGLPPAVVLTAGLDPVRDEGRAYAAGLVAE